VSISREIPPDAIEYAKLQTIRLIAEAQEKNCCYYKSYVGRLSTYPLTLYFWDAKGKRYSRTINLQSIFSRAGISYERRHAQVIKVHIDSAILAAGNIEHHKDAKVVG
jgi:hypothetical protein